MKKILNILAIVLAGIIGAGLIFIGGLWLLFAYPAHREIAKSTLQPQTVSGIYEPLVFLGKWKGDYGDVDESSDLSKISSQIRNPSWLYEKDGSSSIFLKINYTKEIEIRIDKKNFYAVLSPKAGRVAFMDEKNKTAVFVDLSTGEIIRFNGEMENTNRTYQDNFPGLYSTESEKIFVCNESPSGNLIDFEKSAVSPLKEKDFTEKFKWEFRDINYSMESYADAIDAASQYTGTTFAESPENKEKFYSPQGNFYYTIEKISTGLCIDSCGLIHRISVYSKNGDKISTYSNDSWFIPFSWSEDEKKIYLATFLGEKDLGGLKEKRRAIREISIN